MGHQKIFRGVQAPLCSATWEVFEQKSFVQVACLKSGGGLETKDNCLREAWQRKS